MLGSLDKVVHMTQKLIVTRGLPGSGKSSFARKILEYSANDVVRLERDLLRDMLFNTRVPNGEREDVITKVQFSMAEAAALAGKDIIVSDMNLKAEYVRNWAKFAAKHNMKFETVEFDVDVDICVARDANRKGPEFLGEDIIRSIAKRFLKKGKIQSVDVSKELSTSWNIVPVEQDSSLPPAILVDIDGTLAKMSDRSPYDWHRVGEDTPVQAVIAAVRSAAYYNSVIVMSGRDESCRYITEAWLGQHLGVPFQLYMRPEGDNRKDDLVKYELFNDHIRGQFNVTYVLDDRDQVVKMWRALGLACFQVNYGNF